MRPYLTLILFALVLGVALIGPVVLAWWVSPPLGIAVLLLKLVGLALVRVAGRKS